MSRRDFLRLNAALVVLAGTSSCSWSDDTSDERRELQLLRPEDLLAVRFELRNLRIVHRRNAPSRLERIRPGDDAWITVRFPGQHIAEQTYPDTGSERILLPAQARIARPTRLVFRLPAALDGLNLTIDELLGWQHWLPEWPAPTGATSGAGSLIELPTGLALSPGETARWKHANHPVTHNGRTELWHTRLTPAGPGTSSTVAILQPGYDAGGIDAFDPPLTAGDRDRLTGRRAEARTLVLSPMGGWLELYGRWEADPSLSRWEHRSAAGQDQHVLLEREQGFLYPFGHPATLISVTERRLDTAFDPSGREPRDTALLRRRDFIVIKQPTVDYEHGRMALRSLTAETLVTPPLFGADPSPGPFWIETAPGTPYLFRFTGEDWAGHRHEVEAAAVFMAAQPADAATAPADPTAARHTAEAAGDVYRREPDRRTADLGGRFVVVARYAPATGDAAAARPRSEGDTTLRLLRLSFAGASRQALVAGRDAPFTCRTDGMRAGVPALEPYLPEARNQGWFDLDDPDSADNRGEVFAVARGDRIPMAFDQQADRCGGVATPSFLVDALSRTLGPVGDAKAIRDGTPIDYGRYFTAGAELLGGFSLAGVLPSASGTTSPAIPRIDFTVSRRQPGKQARPGENAQWEVALGLSWTVPLQKFGGTPIEFRPAIDEETGRSRAALVIAAHASKKLGKQAPPAGPAEPDEAATDAPAAGDGDAPAVDWSVSGKVSHFSIALTAGELGGLDVGFEYLGVRLGPAKPEAAEPAEEDEKNPSGDAEPSEEPDAPDEPPPADAADTDTETGSGEPGEEDKKKKKKKLKPELEYKLSGITGEGILSFINPLMAAAARLPDLPDLDFGAEAATYPAKLPDASDADLGVTIGPIEAPKFNWLQFEVSNVSASVGVGLYFFPRQKKPDSVPAVPPNLFTVRLASADNPVTLIAEPWGGIAYLAANFTSEGLTAFRFALGIVYRATIDLSVSKARCEGSLTGVFTYQVKDTGDAGTEIDLILKLSGKAKVAGFIEVSVGLVAVGKWQCGLWEFYAEIAVRVKIAFFAISVTFRFRHQIVGGSCERDALATAAPTADDLALTESEWLQYRSAFAEAA